MYNYFKKYKKYYDSLLGNENIISSSKNLISKVSEAYLQNKNNFSRIDNSLWKENGKVYIINQIFSSLNQNINKLVESISNNLANACSLAIESLLPIITQIKEKDEKLDKIINEVNYLEKQLDTIPSTIKVILPNGNYTYKDNQEYISLLNYINSLKNNIENQKKELENLCTEADQIINQINSLVIESSTNSSIEGISNKELVEYLLSLSDKELEEFLANYEGELILEIPLNLLEFGLTSIDEMPTIRYDIKAIYDLLEDNEYKSLMINYLIGYAGGDVDIKSFYEKYPDLLPKWNSTKYDPVYLFDYSMFAKEYRSNTELASALNIILDHTIASTMLPYYQNGTLNTHKAVECSSIVLASDFLVHFSYGAPNDLTQEYMWREDTSSIVGIGGGNCHHFGTGVLYRAMSLFSETSLANGTSRIKDSSSPFHELFRCNKIPGAGDFENSPNITTLNTSETLNSFTKGTVAAINGKNGSHVIIYLDKGVDANGNSVNIIADSNNTNGVSIRTMSDNELRHYNNLVTESNIGSLHNYSDTAINYEKYANKYGVNVN